MGLIKRTVRKKVTRPARKRAERATSRECPHCHKRYTNPLTHVCTVETDFAKRKRADGRARKREEARARKKAAAERRRAAAAERRKKAAAKRSGARRRPSARPAHDYRLCRDGDCKSHACAAYKTGYEDGLSDA